MYGILVDKKFIHSQCQAECKAMMLDKANAGV